MVVEYREHAGAYGGGLKTNKRNITQVTSDTVIMQVAYIVVVVECRDDADTHGCGV